MQRGKVLTVKSPLVGVSPPGRHLFELTLSPPRRLIILRTMMPHVEGVEQLLSRISDSALGPTCCFRKCNESVTLQMHLTRFPNFWDIITLDFVTAHPWGVVYIVPIHDSRCEKTSGLAADCAHDDTACVRMMTESGIMLLNHRVIFDTLSMFFTAGTS